MVHFKSTIPGELCGYKSWSGANPLINKTKQGSKRSLPQKGIKNRRDAAQDVHAYPARCHISCSRHIQSITKFYGCRYDTISLVGPYGPSNCVLKDGNHCIHSAQLTAKTQFFLSHRLWILNHYYLLGNKTLFCSLSSWVHTIWSQHHLLLNIYQSISGGIP